VFSLPTSGRKISKSFLVYNDQEPPKIHNLVELVRLCNDFDKDFSTIIPKCEYLIPFAIQTRYPSKIDIEEEDMKKALAYAQAIIEFVKPKIPR
jgi:HEPN domain-containing protein